MNGKSKKGQVLKKKRQEVENEKKQSSVQKGRESRKSRKQLKRGVWRFKQSSQLVVRRLRPSRMYCREVAVVICAG